MLSTVIVRQSGDKIHVTDIFNLKQNNGLTNNDFAIWHN